MSAFAGTLAGKVETYIELRHSLGYSFKKQAGTLHAFARYVASGSLTPAYQVHGARVRPVIWWRGQWMRGERARLSRHADVAKVMDYMLKRWGSFTRFLDDGRICLTNNAAERGLRGIALGRKAWLFAGSDRGGERAAAMYSLIVTAKLNDVDPRAWLANVLVASRIIPFNVCTSCCRGTGVNEPRKPLPPPERPRRVTSRMDTLR